MIRRQRALFSALRPARQGQVMAFAQLFRWWSVPVEGTVGAAPALKKSDISTNTACIVTIPTLPLFQQKPHFRTRAHARAMMVVVVSSKVPRENRRIVGNSQWKTDFGKFQKHHKEGSSPVGRLGAFSSSAQHRWQSCSGNARRAVQQRSSCRTSGCWSVIRERKGNFTMPKARRELRVCRAARRSVRSGR